MNPVVHFEIPANDRERSKKFYETVFDWKINQLGPEMNNYVVVHTGATDDAGMMQEKGMINGGIYEKTPDMPPQFPSIVIGVKDIHEHIKKINAAGGKVLMEPMSIPGVGMFAAFEDTEGNNIRILQPTHAM